MEGTSGSGAQMKKALIIDDERLIRLILEEALSPTHICSLVCDGREGVRLASESGHYDIITMDLHMPEWDGESALAMLDTLNPTARVIVITGHISAQDREELQKFNCVRHIMTKPLIVDEFCQAVECVEKDSLP